METHFLDSWSDPAGATRASDLFTATYGGEPDGVWAAPGRVNLIGEHTDYNGGLALPIALPHRTYAAARRRADRTVHLVWTGERTWELNLDEVRPDGPKSGPTGWMAYVVGVAWALEQAGYGPLPGFDIACASCVPFGSGLSSSAAIECSAALAIDAIGGLGLDTEEGRKVLQAASIRAENDIAGAPTGGMDQAASLRAKAGHALLLDCRTNQVSHVPFDLSGAGLELLVIDTRVRHANSDGQYAARRKTCEDAARTLGVRFLGEITNLSDALDHLSDDVSRRRVRHVVTEIARVRETVAALREGKLTAERARRVGELFDASHESLRLDYEVTCPELDVAVEAARAGGALGARMTGAGFGGAAIALIPVERAVSIAQDIVRAFAARDFAAPQFLVAQPAQPAAAIRTR